MDHSGSDAGTAGSAGVLLSGEEVLLALAAMLLVSRADMAGLARLAGRLHSAQALLTDLLPGHVVQLLMHHHNAPAGEAAGAGADASGTLLKASGSSVGGPRSSLTGDAVMSSQESLTLAAAIQGVTSSSTPTVPTTLQSRGTRATTIPSRLSTARSHCALPSPPGSTDGPQSMPGLDALGQLGQSPDSPVAVAAGAPRPLLLAPEWHDDVSILMCDVVGYTEFSHAVRPEDVVRLLHDLYCRFDAAAAELPDVYKVETIGDCYLAAVGLMQPCADHAALAVRLGLALLAAAREVVMAMPGGEARPVTCRVGVHSGAVLTGLIGRTRRQYRVFGDAVNSGCGEGGRGWGVAGCKCWCIDTQLQWLP
jgi:hypothetical protein